MTEPSAENSESSPVASRSGLAIVFLVVFIDLLGFGIVLPLLPRFGKHFHAGGWKIGFLMASFSAMQFLFAPMWGRLSDRIGRRPVLLLGLAGSTLSYGLFGLFIKLGIDGTLLGYDTLYWLFATRVGAGIAGATIPTAQAYIADSTTTKTRGKGMALIGVAFGLGFTFGPLIAAPFAADSLEAPPSAWPGYLGAILSGLALLAAIVLLPESLRPNSGGARRSWLNLSALGKAWSRQNMAGLLFTMFLTTFAFAQFESTLSLLTEQLGMPERQNFYVFAFIGLTLMISQGLFVRRLLPQWGERRMAITGALLMTIGLPLLYFAGDAATRTMLTTYGIDFTPLQRLLAVLPVTIIGFSALTPSLQSVLSLNSGAEEQGEMLGLGQSVSALARIVGPVAGVRLFHAHPQAPYLSASALMLCGTILVAIYGRRPE